MIRIGITILALAILASCGNGSAKKATPKSTTSTVVESKYDLPPMPKDEYIKMREKTTAVDYIFHTMPFSINQTDKESVLSNLGLISPEAADPIPASCQPFAREIFQANGEIFMEADIYFTDGCMGYVFIEGRTPKYANKMSQGGADFYTNLMKQVQVTAPK